VIVRRRKTRVAPTDRKKLRTFLPRDWKQAGLLISQKISISDCDSDIGVFFIADYRTMKFQKSIDAIIADSRRYFLQSCIIKKKIKYFSAYFFQKQKNYISNIPCFPARTWY
jgi:hypothetical protein